MSIALLLVCTLLFNIPGGLGETTKPDFTGIWNARVLQSAATPLQGLKISYAEPKLKISRVLMSQKPSPGMGLPIRTMSSREFVFYTDGRGETHRSDFESGSMRSKTERVGEKFVTVYESKRSGKNTTVDSTVTFEVRPDGTTLIETTTLGAELGNKQIVHLYDRMGDIKSSDINGDWVRRVNNRIVSLTVEHRDPEIKVTRRVISDTQDETETAVYYSDGRGETNVKDGRSIKSVTKWKDDNLVFELSSTTSIGNDHFEFKQSIKWQIAKDGSLSEVTEEKRSSNKGAIIPGTKTTTLVYARSAAPLP